MPEDEQVLIAIIVAAVVFIVACIALNHPIPEQTNVMFRYQDLVAGVLTVVGTVGGVGLTIRHYWHSEERKRQAKIAAALDSFNEDFGELESLLADMREVCGDFYVEMIRPKRDPPRATDEAFAELSENAWRIHELIIAIDAAHCPRASDVGFNVAKVRHVLQSIHDTISVPEIGTTVISRGPDWNQTVDRFQMLNRTVDTVQARINRKRSNAEAHGLTG